jgi:hypothetical protein
VETLVFITGFFILLLLPVLCRTLCYLLEPFFDPALDPLILGVFESPIFKVLLELAYF